MNSLLDTAEKVVSQLSDEDLAKFRQWFAEYDGQLWDAQIEADVAAGRLDELAREALAEYHAGKTCAI
jgi:hypothetical protein